MGLSARLSCLWTGRETSVTRSERFGTPTATRSPGAREMRSSPLKSRAGIRRNDRQQAVILSGSGSEGWRRPDARKERGLGVPTQLRRLWKIYIERYPGSKPCDQVTCFCQEFSPCNPIVGG